MLIYLFVDGWDVWQEIVCESGIIEILTELLLQTKNLRIRTLCGAVIETIQQRETEINEVVDWQTLLSPLISLLFNRDELVSESGKQSLIMSIEMRPESFIGLINLSIFDKASEVLDTYTQSQSSQSSQVIPEIPITILIKVLEVIEKGVHLIFDYGKKTYNFKIVSQKVMYTISEERIKDLLSSILFILQEQEEADEFEGTLKEKGQRIEIQQIR
ncbi:MAG: hypothetical protein EZS28_038192, partial [Streblomastix strix]